VLSALLIHYYFDHFLFLRIDGVITPRGESAAPAARPAPSAGSRNAGVAARLPVA
jgi:hypothetical protein